MLDVSVAYNRYKFLGHEFLTWLWFVIENEPDQLKDENGQPVLLRIGNRMVLENSRREALETITIKGSESELEEGRLALRNGAVVTEMNLYFRFNDLLWIFDIKGESLDISGLKTPESETEESPAGSGPAGRSKAPAGTSARVQGDAAPASSPHDSPNDKLELEANLLLRMDMYETMVSFVQYIYKQFIGRRISAAWQDKTVPRIRKWMNAA